MLVDLAYKKHRVCFRPVMELSCIDKGADPISESLNQPECKKYFHMQQPKAKELDQDEVRQLADERTLTNSCYNPWQR